MRRVAWKPERDFHIAVKAALSKNAESAGRGQIRPTQLSPARPIPAAPFEGDALCFRCVITLLADFWREARCAARGASRPFSCFLLTVSCPPKRNAAISISKSTHGFNSRERHRVCSWGVALTRKLTASRALAGPPLHLRPWRAVGRRGAAEWQRLPFDLVTPQLEARECQTSPFNLLVLSQRGNSASIKHIPGERRRRRRLITAAPPAQTRCL